MKQINTNSVYHVDKISSAKDIGDTISGAIDQLIKIILSNVGRTDYRFSHNMGQEVEKIVSEYTQKSCEITAKNVAIHFAEHLIDKNISDKSKLESVYTELFYGEDAKQT